MIGAGVSGRGDGNVAVARCDGFRSSRCPLQQVVPPPTAAQR